MLLFSNAKPPKLRQWSPRLITQLDHGETSPKWQLAGSRPVSAMTALPLLVSSYSESPLSTHCGSWASVSSQQLPQPNRCPSTPPPQKPKPSGHFCPLGAASPECHPRRAPRGKRPGLFSSLTSTFRRSAPWPGRSGLGRRCPGRPSRRPSG